MNTLTKFALGLIDQLRATPLTSLLPAARCESCAFVPAGTAAQIEGWLKGASPP